MAGQGVAEENRGEKWEEDHLLSAGAFRTEGGMNIRVTFRN